MVMYDNNDDTYMFLFSYYYVCPEQGPYADALKDRGLFPSVADIFISVDYTDVTHLNFIEVSSVCKMFHYSHHCLNIRHLHNFYVFISILSCINGVLLMVKLVYIFS